MATSTILSNPVVTVGAVDLSDQCRSATFNQTYAQLQATAFGDVDEKYVKGLGNHSVELELYMSYAASETYATLKDLVGSRICSPWASFPLFPSPLMVGYIPQT